MFVLTIISEAYSSGEKNLITYYLKRFSVSFPYYWKLNHRLKSLPRNILGPELSEFLLYSGVASLGSYPLVYYLTGR